MGSKHRRCDDRCHYARGPICNCWCGGVFHGARGAAAREAFIEAYGELLEDDPNEVEPLFRGQQNDFENAMAGARKVWAEDG